MTKRVNLQDRKEETFLFLPRADQIAPDRVFRTGEGTAQQLTKHLGMSNKAALNNLNRLKAEDRVHIHTWTRTQNPSPVWVQGAGEDAEKPACSPRESVRRYREKVKTERKAHPKVVVDSRERTAQTIERAKQQPQTWWSGLGDITTGESNA
jgi:hypothetical protein